MVLDNTDRKWAANMSQRYAEMNDGDPPRTLIPHDLETSDRIQASGQDAQRLVYRMVSLTSSVQCL